MNCTIFMFNILNALIAREELNILEHTYKFLLERSKNQHHLVWLFSLK